MSMLAERRRKQKWSLNPRGKEWSQDSNKFGQKLLEKMGWSHGKGLGAKEDGITEHIKVSYKNDSQGMGYKESNDQWTEHESNFSALLESLTGTESKIDELKVNSLEKKSKTSRARVHYHKFTRGKDLSRYSEKDLANIFGKKSLKKNVDEEKTEEPVEEKYVENKFLFNGGSITDYFKKKIPNFGKINGYVIGNNGVLKKEEEEEPEKRINGFKKECHESEDEVCTYRGFGFKEQPKQETFISYVNDNPENTQHEKKKKEKKKKRKLEETEDTEITKKIKTDPNENLGLNNPAFNPMCTPVKLQKHVLNTIEENFENSRESICEESEKINVIAQINNEITPKKRKNSEENEDTSESKKKKKNNKETIEDIEVVEKKKKKKDKDIGISNPGFPTEENAPEPKQSKKKKKKKTTDDENENVVSVENASEIIEINPYEVKVKKKKKKTATVTEEDFAVENPAFNANLTSNSEETTTSNNNIEENPYEVKVKSKKKKKKSAKEEEYVIDNPGFNPDDSVAPQVVNEEFEVKRKKKKRKENENGLDNPCLDLNDSKNDNPNENNLNTQEIIEDNELMLNIISTPISKPQLNNSTGILSSSKTNSVKRRKSVRFSNVNEERLIPSIRALQQLEDTERRNELFDINNEVISKNLENGKKRKLGLDNNGFDRNSTNLEENVDSIAKTLDQYQAEIENDINEAKLKTVEMSDIMIGEVGNPHGDNEKLENGSAKLKFKHAKFGRTPGYIENMTGPKKSYKHLIKGDIIVNFKESNLHEIQGYGSEKMVEA